MTAEKLSYYFSVLVVSFLLHLLKAYWMEKLLVFKYALASYNKCFERKSLRKFHTVLSSEMNLMLHNRRQILQ